MECFLEILLQFGVECGTDIKCIEDFVTIVLVKQTNKKFSVGLIAIKKNTRIIQ